MVLPFHERSESDDAASHCKITESYVIDCFLGTGPPQSQLYNKQDSNITHLSSNVWNPNRSACAHITGANARATKFCTVGPWYKILFMSPLLESRILSYLFEFCKISVPPGRAVLDLHFLQKKGFLSSLKIQTTLEVNPASSSIGTKGLSQC
jgi:hypothetical protein